MDPQDPICYKLGYEIYLQSMSDECVSTFTTTTTTTTTTTFAGAFRKKRNTLSETTIFKKKIQGIIKI